MVPLIIWGKGGHAQVVADIIRLCGRHEIARHIEGGEERFGEMTRGQHLIIAFGHCQARLRLVEMALDRDLCVIRAIHPWAILAADICLGAGVVIAAGAVVNPSAKIGDAVIINTCASVDHGCIIENGAHICPGARLAGRVRIGRETQIGIGATVIENINIGSGSIIGAGAVVTQDIPDNVIAFGVPARIQRCKQSSM